MITLSFDQDEITQAMAKLEKQATFAAVQALTKTAQDAQEEVKRQLPARFTIRTTWLARGVRIMPATKIRLESVVLVKDEFMALQETGGEKRAEHDAMGVPVGARPTSQSVTRPSKYPGALLAKSGYFIAPLSRHAGNRTMAVWKRQGRKLQLMYIFAQKVTMKPRLGFRETVSDTATRRFHVRFEQALVQALATAR